MATPHGPGEGSAILHFRDVDHEVERIASADERGHYYVLVDDVPVYLTADGKLLKYSELWIYGSQIQQTTVDDRTVIIARERKVPSAAIIARERKAPESSISKEEEKVGARRLDDEGAASAGLITFIDGHGGSSEELTFVPRGMNFQFYCLDGCMYRRGTLVALKYDSIEIFRVDPVREGEDLPNYVLAPLKGDEILASAEFLAEFPDRNLLFVGQPPFEDVQGFCSQADICNEKRKLNHDMHDKSCSGLLSPKTALLVGSSIHVLFCRGGEDGLKSDSSQQARDALIREREGLGPADPIPDSAIERFIKQAFGSREEWEKVPPAVRDNLLADASPLNAEGRRKLFAIQAGTRIGEGIRLDLLLEAIDRLSQAARTAKSAAGSGWPVGTGVNRDLAEKLEKAASLILAITKELQRITISALMQDPAQETDGIQNSDNAEKPPEEKKKSWGFQWGSFADFAGGRKQKKAECDDPLKGFHIAKYALTQVVDLDRALNSVYPAGNPLKRAFGDLAQAVQDFSSRRTYGAIAAKSELREKGLL